MRREGDSVGSEPGRQALRWGALLVVAAVMIGSGLWFRSESEAWGSWMARARESGPWGASLFMVLVAITTVLGVPATVHTLLAGFAWGPWKGALIVWPGAVLGAMGAFALSRSLYRDVVARQVAEHPRFGAIDRAVHAEGGRLIVLLRLSPVLPFNLLNYALGVTSVGWRPYTVATAVGILPGTFLYVYFGATVDSLAEVASGRRPAGASVTLWIGLLATVGATILLTRASRRALDAEWAKHEVVSGAESPNAD